MIRDAIRLRNLRFRYQGESLNALKIPHLDIPTGQRVALIGTSGAGKSTLLRMINGGVRGWSGTCKILGQSLDPRRLPSRAWRRQVGFVFQEFALVQRETLERNVLHGRLGHVHPFLSLFGRFSDTDKQAVQCAIRDVGMDDFATRRVDCLSGGQRQRAAIGRCLAQEPRLILADEPISNLDPLTAESILSTLCDRATKRGATLIISSHQPRLIADYVDRCIALEQGRIVFDGPPDELLDAQWSDIYTDTSQPAAFCEKSASPPLVECRAKDGPRAYLTLTRNRRLKVKRINVSESA